MLELENKQNEVEDEQEKNKPSCLLEKIYCELAKNKYFTKLGNMKHVFLHIFFLIFPLPSLPLLPPPQIFLHNTFPLHRMFNITKATQIMNCSAISKNVLIMNINV
jgi:hypothetical protein